MNIKKIALLIVGVSALMSSTASFAVFDSDNIFSSLKSDVFTAANMPHIGAGGGFNPFGGINFMVASSIGPSFTVRAYTEHMSIGRNGNYGSNSVSYDGKLSLKQQGILLDSFPFVTPLHLTVGLVHISNQLKLTSNNPNGSSVTLNGANYVIGQQITDVQGNATWEQHAPYIGIGFGNFSNAAGISITSDIGAIIVSAPNVNLGAQCSAALLSNANGVALCTSANSNLGPDTNSAKNNLHSTFRVWPVIRAQVGYSFF